MAKKKIEQVQEETLITVSLWSQIKQWWRELIREEWELTVFFPGEIKFLEDGSRIESTSPKTYRAKSITKLSTTNIIFTDLLGVKHEIKVVNPVGYDVRKIY
jgi:hypothetical protein